MGRKRTEYAEMRLREALDEDRAPHPDAWTPPEYQLLTEHELLRLPVVDRKAQRSGVYFLFRGSRRSRYVELLYVGVSDNVHRRLKEHRHHGNSGAPSDRILFDTATYLAVPWPWHLALEALYIQAFSPAKNRAGCPVEKKPHLAMGL